MRSTWLGRDPVLLRLVAIAAVLVITLSLFWRYESWLSETYRFQDLRVYRQGADALLSGGGLYADRTVGQGQLVFTYPPFASVVFVPFALVPWAGAVSALLLLSALAYATIVFVVGREFGWPLSRVVGLGVLGLLAEPVLRTVQQGQINLLLAALVVLDLFVVPRRFRGALIGLAAGIKLVPAAFVICFLAQHHWGAVARTAGVGALTLVVSYVAAPDATREYWLRLLFETGRSGGGGYPDNQSVVGVVARVLQDDTPTALLVLPLQAGALTLAYFVARRAHLAGDRVTVLLSAAMGSLLASPVSWSHHWIWCVPLTMALIAHRRYIATAAAAAIFSISPLTLSPLGLLDETPRFVWVVATALMPALGLWWLTCVALRPTPQAGPGSHQTRHDATTRGGHPRRMERPDRPLG